MDTKGGMQLIKRPASLAGRSMDDTFLQLMSEIQHKSPLVGLRSGIGVRFVG